MWFLDGTFKTAPNLFAQVNQSHDPLKAHVFPKVLSISLQNVADFRYNGLGWETGTHG